MPNRVFIDPTNVDPLIIEKAAHLISSGKLVAFPTETVYGIGANAFDRVAVEKIFTVKRRPGTDPIIVHIHALSQLDDVARDVPDLALSLARRFWPNPLTMILRRASNIPDNVSSGLPTVAVRMPNHPIALALLAAAKVPIAAPSANLFTRPSATTGRHVLEDFGSAVDLILDGGAATIGIESTVIDLTVEIPVVLRPGGLPMEPLREIIPTIRIESNYLTGQHPASSPGMLLKHYSPHATVLLFSGEDEARVLEGMRAKAWELKSLGNRVGILVTAHQGVHFSDKTFTKFALGEGPDTDSIAKSLYNGMRALDAEAVDFILVSAPKRQGLGLALWDRLYRAAEGKVLSVD